MMHSPTEARSIRWILLTLLLVAPLVWAGCDTTAPSSNASQDLVLTYEGDVPIKHSALGEGALEVGEDGTVSFKSPTGNGGIRLAVDGARKGDFYFQPAGVSQGGTFTQSVLGKTGEPLAQVNHRRAADGSYRMTANLGKVDVRSAALQLRNGDDVVYEAPLSPTSRTNAPVGKASREPNSWHYSTETIEGEGTVTVISVDYETKVAADPTPPSNRDYAPKSTTNEGQAMIWPSGTKKGPFPSTHVSLVLKGTSISPGDVQGVSLTGAKELTIFNAALGNAY